MYNSDSYIVYCVLPDEYVGIFPSEEYRAVIRSICANVINPNDWNVTFRAIDGVHMNKVDVFYWHYALRQILGI